jgi:putative permease
MRFYVAIREIYTDEKKFRAAILLCIASAVLYSIVAIIYNVFLLFLFAFIFAALLNPYVKKLQRFGIPRSVGAVIFLLSIISLLLVVVAVLSFFAHKHFVYYSTKVDESISFFASWLPQMLNNIAAKLHIHAEINAEKIREYITNSFGSIMELLLRHSMSLFDHAKTIMGSFSSGTFITILTFYLLKDWATIIDKIREYLPENVLSFVNFATPHLVDSLKKQIGGQFKVCAIMAVVYSVLLFFVGLRPYFWVGLLSGLLAFIPFIGVLIACAIAFFVGIAQGLSFVSMLCMGIGFFVGSSLESNVLTPKLVGSRIGVHPIWIFFAVLTTLALFGIGGIVFVMPLATFANSLIHSFRLWLDGLT